MKQNEMTLSAMASSFFAGATAMVFLHTLGTADQAVTAKGAMDAWAKVTVTGFCSVALSSLAVIFFYLSHEKSK